MILEEKNSLTGREGWAWFSDDRLYRYVLGRKISDGPNTIVWCMLNPSTADAFKLDPTITRCLHRSKEMRFGTMIVLNLFAFRSTNPKGLFSVDDPIGIDNDQLIFEETANADLVVVAWGSHKLVADRAPKVLQIFKDLCKDPYCLKITNEGYPQHPLHLSYEEKLRPYDQR